MVMSDDLPSDDPTLDLSLRAARIVVELEEKAARIFRDNPTVVQLIPWGLDETGEITFVLIDACDADL
jgi:hypothetical protein